MNTTMTRALVYYRRFHILCFNTGNTFEIECTVIVCHVHVCFILRIPMYVNLNTSNSHFLSDLPEKAETCCKIQL